MHQWWGDNVSEANYNLTFFKEGMATLRRVPVRRPHRGRPPPAAWTRRPATPRSTQSLVKQFNTNYANNRQPLDRRPVRPDAGHACSRAASTYTRPGTAYIALRQILGTADFTRALQQIQRDYGGGSITEPQLEAGFAHFLPNRSRACQDRLDDFFTQWFDTAYPPGGGANRPQLTGPGLDGPGLLRRGLPLTGLRRRAGPVRDARIGSRLTSTRHISPARPTGVLPESVRVR